MKTIALYVPQYHRIPLNDKYWGEGFTEWDNVRSAKSLFKGHMQPRVPLNDNYYNLLNDEVKQWQVEIARKNHVDAFCFYHYWFDGELLLEKPAEQFLDNKNLDIEFCFSWANEAWTKEWVGKHEVIIAQRYGKKKEWIEHFNYLLPFFKDERYVKENGKPVFVIYRPGSIDCLTEMLECWQEEAKKNGFPGLVFMNQHPIYMKDKNRNSLIDYDIEFEPATSSLNLNDSKFTLLKKIKRSLVQFFEKKWGWDLQRFGQNLMAKMTKNQFPSYDAAWNDILKRKPFSDKSIPCAFVDWDNSPRYKDKGRIYIGANPDKFNKYFFELLKKNKFEYKKEYIFIMAWNEWGEGGYLEPDTLNGYGYLEAIKKAVEEFEGLI